MTQRCDHTSVGVLVWKSGKLLLIERRRPPFGLAPPAGHVDAHESFDDAARAELQEETGLTARDLTALLSGARQNPCRREGGTWHYWRVYEAKATGALAPSQSETKSARWYSLEEISQLLERTRTYVAGGISEPEWQQHPGIEPVWSEIFDELRLSPQATTAVSGDSVAWAREHAWKWFEYHAHQRMVVFQSYLVVLAFLFAGYSTLITNKLPLGAVGVAISLLFVTLLFWRLDLRNMNLVKIAEDALKKDERAVALQLGRSELNLFTEAEARKAKWLGSFRRINAVLFAFIALVSFAMLAAAMWQASRQAPGSEAQKVQASVSVTNPVVILRDVVGPPSKQLPPVRSGDKSPKR